MVVYKSSPTNRRSGNAGKIAAVLLFAASFMLWTSDENGVRRMMDNISSVSITSDSGGEEKSVGATDFQLPVAEFTGNDQEVIIPLDERKPDSEIRYAAFGSSSTWGASLRDREHSAYIWRLSDFDHERGMNLAIRAGGPRYPASCLYTMVEDNEIDVIILEFYLRSWDGLDILSKRIRQRFPNAIIVFLRIYATNLIYIEGEGISVNDWAHSHGYHRSFLQNEKFKNEFLEEAKRENWKFVHQAIEHRNLDTYLEMIANDVAGYLLKMPYNGRPHGPDGFLEIGKHFLAFDSYHQSEGGHEWIANQVKAIVDRVGVPKDTRVEPFSELDQCLNWLLTGSIGEGLKYSPNASVVKMPNTEKYALEFDFEKGGEDGSWIEVHNESAKKMSLAIGYMTTGPPPSKYPKTEAKLPDGQTILLEPESDPGFGMKKVHISRSVNLGTIGALETIRVFFKPLEESQWPFRLMQVMVTPIEEESAK